MKSILYYIRFNVLIKRLNTLFAIWNMEDRYCLFLLIYQHCMSFVVYAVNRHIVCIDGVLGAKCGNKHYQ